MKSYFALILSCFFCIRLAGQEIDSLKRLLETHTEVSSKRASILNQLGYEYWIVNPVESIFYGQKARAMAESVNDSLEIAFAHRVIGVGYWARGMYAQALTHLYDGQRLYQTMEDSLGMANCRMNLGLVYAEQKDYDRALEEYADALKVFEKIGATARIGTTYNKMGTAYLNLGDLGQAEKYLRQGLKTHQDLGYVYGISEALNRLGLFYTAKKQFQTAIGHFERSIDLCRSNNDREGLAKNHENIAVAYLGTGEVQKAEDYLLMGVEIAESIGSDKWLKELFFDLKNIYQKRGDLQKAIYYYDKYITLRESIFNEQTARNIADFEAQLVAVEKERLINQKQQEIDFLEQQSRFDFFIRITLIVLFVLMLVISYLLYVRQRLKMKQKQERAELRAREMDRELEVKNREIASYTVNFIQKNQLFEDLKEVLASVKQSTNVAPHIRERFKEIDRIISSQLQVDKDWEDFKLRFQSLHQDFFDQLMAQSPSLTNNELRLCALVRLNFSMKEIGNILGISAESVKTARYRLKKKLDLPARVNLNDFLNEIGS